MNLPQSEAELEEFLSLVQATHVQAEVSRCLAYSGITLLVFDWICTLDKEMEYLWSRKWNFARITYHLNRVLPIILIGSILIPNILFAPAQVTDLTCKKMILLYSYGSIALLGIICITSILRCWILYNQNWIIWLLAPALIITLGHASLSITLATEKSTFLPNPVPSDIRGCIVALPEKAWLAYLAGILNELLIFSLLVGRIVYLSRGLSLTPLMKQLLKGGTVFFAVNLCLMLFSCIGSAYPSTFVVANSSGLLIALPSIVCSRIFFSLHEFIDEEREHISMGLGASSSLSICPSNSGLQFVVPMRTFDNGGSLLAAPTSVNPPPHTLGRSILLKERETATSYCT